MSNILRIVSESHDNNFYKTIETDDDVDDTDDNSDDDLRSAQLPYARRLGGGNSVTSTTTRTSESTFPRQTSRRTMSTLTRVLTTATSTRPTSSWSTTAARTTATISYGDSDSGTK